MPHHSAAVFHALFSASSAVLFLATLSSALRIRPRAVLADTCALLAGENHLAFGNGKLVLLSSYELMLAELCRCRPRTVANEPLSKSALSSKAYLVVSTRKYVPSPLRFSTLNPKVCRIAYSACDQLLDRATSRLDPSHALTAGVYAYPVTNKCPCCKIQASQKLYTLSRQKGVTHAGTPNRAQYFGCRFCCSW